METKSAIAILEGKIIKAIMCESGDYVNLAPCLQSHWKDQARVKTLIDQGSQKYITESANQPADVATPALTFFNFADFMRHFEKFFCEDYYLMENGVWYYASAGERSVMPLDIKLLPLLRPKSEEEPFCKIHGHSH